MSKISRREFIRLSALASAGIAVAACAKTEEPPAATATPKPAVVEPTATPVPEAGPSANQSPMLADQVSAGTIPPLEERAPKNPWVYPPNDGIGNFGGYMRRAFSGVSDAWGCRKHIDRKWVTWSPDLALIPRLCESWELSDDATTWTWHMREGAKWSDGVPFTSADYKWTWDNYTNNEELNPRFPTRYSTINPADGEWRPGTFDAPDDYTFVFTFQDPNPMFIYSMYRDYREPHCSHFMAQFHMDLTDDKAALEAMIADEGVETWMDVYNNRWEFGLSLGASSPSTYPWNAVNTMRDEVFLLERNPYFYGGDTEGNQYPYLDNVQFRLFDSGEVLNLRVVGGEIDFQNRHLSLSNYTLFKENEDAGDYHIITGFKSSHIAMQCNHTTKNLPLREFFQNRNCRIAMSYAANREQMNDLVYSGQYTPRQYSPLEVSPDYYADLSNAYLEYDPDKANQMLDDEGYTERDADGYRMLKDGSGPVSFVIESTMGVANVEEDAVNLWIDQLKAIGIKAQLLIEERSIYTEHYGANDVDAAWWGGDRTIVPLAAPIIFIGTQPDRPWCPAWGYWRNDPTDPNAEEPPDGHFIREIWRIWDEEIAVEPDEAKQHAAFRKILEIWKEELPFVGLLGNEPGPVIAKNGFRGYLAGYPIDDVTSDEHLLQTESYYWENPEEHSL